MESQFGRCDPPEESRAGTLTCRRDGPGSVRAIAMINEGAVSVCARPDDGRTSDGTVLTLRNPPGDTNDIMSAERRAPSAERRAPSAERPGVPAPRGGAGMTSPASAPCASRRPDCRPPERLPGGAGRRPSPPASPLRSLRVPRASGAWRAAACALVRTEGRLGAIEPRSVGGRRDALAGAVGRTADR